jgi:hypothetical protein
MQYFDSNIFDFVILSKVGEVSGKAKKYFKPQPFFDILPINDHV